jgi:hypothetical protein
MMFKFSPEKIPLSHKAMGGERGREKFGQQTF